MLTEPRPAETDEARVTVLLLAYNQAATVASAVHSVLRQEGGPFEIILSDDASTDGTYAILQQLADAYRGPHTVRVRRNPRNLGIGGHYNALVSEAQGQLLVTAAGDDISEPHRVRTLQQAWLAHGCRPDLIASHLRDLDARGHVGEVLRVDDLSRWHGVRDWCHQRPHVVGAAHAFTRRLWQSFGPLNTDVVYEDQVIALRALMRGGAVTVDEALVQYRRGGASAAHRAEDSAAFLHRVRLACDRSTAEHRQQIEDAQRAGHGPAVREALVPDMARDTFMRAVLQAPGDAAALRLVASSRAGTLGWRLRRCAYLRWPGLGAAIRQVQFGLRQWRSARRDRA